MNTSVLTQSDVNQMADVDFIEEMKLRTWARKNYVPAHERDEDLHPIILDEMQTADRENQ